MTEGLLWWQWIIITGMFLILAVSAAVVLAGLRRSGQISRLERELEAIRQRETARSNGHFGVETMRRRMRGAADEELGTARADLAAFAALLLSMALVGAAIWAASGWWG